MALTRISKDREELRRHPLENICASPSDDDPFVWEVTMLGPPGTPYEDGVFLLDMSFSEDYPFIKPKVKFRTAVYHPNVNEKGDICLDILTYQWNARYTISSVLLCVYTLLADPSPDDYLDLDIATELLYNKQAFEETAREWTRKWAT